ncbi:serine/threonine-protein kinase [Aspergillus saccharolyticus JOP 1030-1]|uniref:Pkinase-domain-containing protein n=1 Tax=Aspergillus saccharolyticus JOP 1030-1 TaxID=1450539 RepID=A0A319A8B1_9EURO|nr:Pkinase-domain-containing protein [Aspergillus saccharolyticus JOP 1030-1]PYH47988.1 Pkinase-domain-containing protein [Aspergillus saccharolyticus JOP 1030-1]
MEATQESTQPCTDPRRAGYNNSGLFEDDMTDIICILHPNSPAAHEAVAATARQSPQHILQRHALDYECSDTAALDFALRLSSQVRDPCAGFYFGRNPSRSDLLLTAQGDMGKISNTHYRIFLTEDGIIMLEDISTNGTIVDNSRLRKTQKERSRMLVNGSVIQVMNGENASDEVRFIVRIPSRDGYMMQYTENIVRYFERISKLQPQQAGKMARNHRATPAPALQMSGSNTYGMHWSGGSTYNVTGQIGKGAFATVYKLATKQHGTVYAAKELDKRRFMKNGILDKKVDNEMQIMRDLKHPNIVQYIDHHEHDRWIYIIMEYVPCGELSTYLQLHGKIEEDMVKPMARQILHALQYLHARKVTHRDIKPDNILISSFDPLTVKLSDFGLSKVVQEETFLRTFCGTLLYCAPEVYPEYETYRRGEIKKRRRLGDPPPQTSPYGQSVDMWSLGAVLFHLLAGVPPFAPRGDDRGAQMLRIIMTEDAEYDQLRSVGVSEEGIDFVARLLTRDPHSRPNERQCFQHPWIANVPDFDQYDDNEDKSDMVEGLPDIGEDAEGELDASQLSLNEKAVEIHEEGSDLAQSKKIKLDFPSASIRYPSLPELESFASFQPVAQSTPKRLFGEITPSVLHSSHALGENVDAFEGDDDFSINDFMSSTGESMISDGNSLFSILSLPENPIAGSAPSLMGAEKLIGQLNVNSLDPGTSSPNLQGVEAQEPPTKTNIGDPVKQASSTKQRTDVVEETPKPSAIFSRRIELPMPDTASDRSSPGSLAKEKTKEPKAESGEEIFNIELANTIDARTGKQLLDINKRPEPPEPPTEPDPEPDGVPLRVPQPMPQRKEPRLLGKLSTLPGSIFDLTLRLENRMTSWGRGPQATICYPEPMDTRIPAYALEVTFWAPAIEAKIAEGQDWLSLPGVMAILSTKTRKCIWVNGTELRRGPEQDNNNREGFHFGKLYTGDVITVYQHRNKFLRFECEFYHGDSARRRPEAEKGFTVRKVLMPKEKAANQMPVRKDYARK